ncbi:hypothetical protein Afil01_42100 [Actinorhabdospora filicis]|uniref:ABM domain-containing protein n=1 Tax=Actinorhabdospora filicis TaxID=1785913 RepID=A0A9W6WAV0_9ACTN|nr:antibiotic biosynthesis monooxygenase family protein [Actinorhabdospora filicis]GLZ79403.1 hypothetical protein Afil01_42100 [Actinorhabdospora filicis]
MLVVNRFDVPEGGEETFLQQGEAALTALSARPGFLRGRLTRAMDEPGRWCLVSEWESVGSYRRALSNFDVKMYGTPLLAAALPEASAFEVRLEATPGELRAFEGDLAPGGAA